MSDSCYHVYRVNGAWHRLTKISAPLSQEEALRLVSERIRMGEARAKKFALIRARSLPTDIVNRILPRHAFYQERVTEERRATIVGGEVRVIEVINIEALRQFLSSIDKVVVDTTSTEAETEVSPSTSINNPFSVAPSIV